MNILLKIIECEPGFVCTCCHRWLFSKTLKVLDENKDDFMYMKVSYSVLFYVEVELGSNMFSVSRNRLIVDKLLPCLQHSFSSLQKYYPWKYINTFCGIGFDMFFKVADGITTLLTMADCMAYFWCVGRWCAMVWQMLWSHVLDLCLADVKPRCGRWNMW